ncbi:hypothetical protein [Deinococcus planocerae]|uniref:hypothetical protein n=1 Tax=Deinococcus planocerae TaxID=1737569 RepID=UPI0015E13513|nr:hypothetical protein [Deinococcus planocerae]
MAHSSRGGARGAAWGDGSFRVLGVASRPVPDGAPTEANLSFESSLLFLDPPKGTPARA